MYNSSNPAELYPQTTWEELPADKFLKTGSSPLVQAGTNSIKIAKANLPAEKLQVSSFSMTRGTMEITGDCNLQRIDDASVSYADGAFYTTTPPSGKRAYTGTGWVGAHTFRFQASRSWTGSTSAASPYTTNMGSGTPLEINPAHITLKAWKRLT